MTATESACLLCRDMQFVALFEAVEADDIDRAISLGLLDHVPSIRLCPICTDRRARVLAARDARLRALAARERFRKRETRLHERERMRAEKRRAMGASSTASAADDASSPASTPKPALPPAAAAALTRAKAKAAAKHEGER